MSTKFGLLVSVLVSCFGFSPSSRASGASTVQNVEHFIRGELKALFRSSILAIYPNRLSSVERRAFERLFPFSESLEVSNVAPLYQDIERSAYVVREQCLDANGVRRAASSRMRDLGGEICFDAGYIAQQRYTLAELLGLTMHEHAHHFGGADPRQRWISIWTRHLAPVLSAENTSYLESRLPVGFCSMTSSSIRINERLDHPYYRGDYFGALIRNEVVRHRFGPTNGLMALSLAYHRDNDAENLAMRLSFGPRLASWPACAIWAVGNLNLGSRFEAFERVDDHYVSRDCREYGLEDELAGWHQPTEPYRRGCYPGIEMGGMSVQLSFGSSARRRETFLNPGTGLESAPVIVRGEI